MTDSIVTQSEITWDEIDSLTKEKIISYYQSTWGDSIHLNTIPLIKEIHEKACLNSRLRMAYVAVEYVKREDDGLFGHNFKGVPIENTLAPYMNESESLSTDIHPLTYQTIEKLLGETALAHDKGTGEIVVIYDHSGKFQDFQPLPSKLFYKDNKGEGEKVLYCKNSPLRGFVSVINPSVMTEINERIEKQESKKKEPKKTTEKSREDSLYDWLRMQGVDVERQVKTSSNHIIDLWIPDKMMIEIKRSSVSGNDICQCIEYASEYRTPIILVGDKVSGAASRGIKGFNKLCPNNKILFISWDAIHEFLKGKLGL